MVTTCPPKTIVKPTALGPVANTDTKLLIYGLFQKGRVLAQDGSVDMTLPVVVPIRWAGDTPIVTITDMVIPGLDGTFTARVMFYVERYAGSWQHGEYGGLMYGTIAPLSD